MASVPLALDRPRVRDAGIVAVAALVAFVAGRGDLGRPAHLVALVAGGLVAAGAVRWPDAAACAALGLVVVVPTYWAQPLPLLPVVGTAAALTGALLLPAAVGSLDRFRFTALDGLVLLYFLLAAASMVANVSGATGAIADLLARSAVPYAVFRVLAARPGAPARLGATLVAVAVPLAVVGLREGAGAGNPFFTLVRPGFEASRWLRSQVRFGEIRAESSFGHAIAFSLFLAIALVVLLGLAWRSRSELARVSLTGGAGVLVFALFATRSRAGLVSVVIGLVVWAVTLRGRRVGLLVVAGVIAGGLLLTPAGDEVAQLRDSVSGTGEAAESAQYRLDIARLVGDPRLFSILGQEAPSGLSVVDSARALTGLRTIDNQYAVVYLTFGAVGLAAFVAVVAAAIVTTLRRRLDPVERAWAAACVATALALLTVALFTQMVTLFWITVAVTAAAGGSRRTETGGAGPDAPRSSPSSGEGGI